jgi:hypothetical protein
VLGEIEGEPAAGEVEGLLEVGEVAGEVLTLAQRGGVGVGGVLAAAPVGGPQGSERAGGAGEEPADAGSQHHLPGKRQQIETETGRSVEARCDSGAELRGACRLGVHGRAEARLRARMRVLHAQTEGRPGGESHGTQMAQEMELRA